MKKLNFDFEIEGILYNVTVSGNREEWVIEDIEKYDSSSQSGMESISDEEYDRLTELLNLNDSFLQQVEQEFAEHEASYAEWIRDEEIEGKIDEALLGKGWEKRKEK